MKQEKNAEHFGRKRGIEWSRRGLLETDKSMEGSKTKMTLTENFVYKVVSSDRICLQNGENIKEKEYRIW